jgi:hypothetical protein
VLCILFMMAVHVNPGPGQPSAVTTGAFAALGAIWVAWTALAGPAEARSCLLFFLGAPLVALAAGQVLGSLADRLPAPVQRLLRGRAVPPVDGGTASPPRVVAR